MKITKLILVMVFISSSTVYAKVHEVLVSSNNFSPSALTIQAGDTVRWVNTGGHHNVVARNNSFRCAQGCDGDGNGGNGNASDEPWIVEITFRTPGSIDYFCEPHDVFGMRGNITITAPNSSVPEIRAQGNNIFSPNDITVTQNELVRLRNFGGVHNFQADNGEVICAQSCVGDNLFLGTEPTGFPWDVYVRFNTVGSVPYHCAAHQGDGMVGVVHVLTELIFSHSFE